jgi:hypothetical protein
LNKAIIWLCWGDRFVREAVDAARATAAIGADRFLITDVESAPHGRDSGQFTAVITADLERKNNLEKSRLIELIPRGYDVYLYLDTDVRIVGDVTLGFEKARQHGIAVAPAPNYNLAEFFNFARVMRDVGFEPADQLVYNAGVIFFHLTPAVGRVLERWRDLCTNVGATLDFPYDQPFLTLAMEQLAFTPYVLSPLYNYRSLGEYAVGNVRIWHSHFPPPPDLNVFETAWPARRFRDGRRLTGDADPPRLPQGMMHLALPQVARTRTPDALRALADNAGTLLERHGSRAANEYLLADIGTEMSRDNNESYFLEAVHYHLALLYAYAGAPEQMAEHMRLSRTMPTGEDDQLYSDHVNVSHVLRAEQIRATERGMPPVLIACMPRSASATLTHTLGRALGMPVLHVSAGRFRQNFLIPCWLDMFLEGGAVTQDHFAANDFNLGVLATRGLRDVFVVARDPRAAARSQVHFQSPPDTDRALLEAKIERECTANFVPWLQSWMACARRLDLPYRIHWLTYREVTTDVAAAVRKICGVLHFNYPALSAHVQATSIAELRVHFVTGDDQAWRAEVGSAARERLWEACTPDMRRLLDLEF